MDEVFEMDFHPVDGEMMPTTKEERWKLDGCVYNWEGIRCPNRATCYKCGWNPRIERQRKRKMREESNAGHSV